MGLSESFEKYKYVPAVIVDDKTNNVLSLVHLNKEAFDQCLKTHRVWYYEGKTAQVVMKGAKHGNTQKILSIKADDGYKSLLIRVIQKGHVFHQGDVSFDTTYIHGVYKRSTSSVSRPHTHKTSSNI